MNKEPSLVRIMKKQVKKFRDTVLLNIGQSSNLSEKVQYQRPSLLTEGIALTLARRSNTSDHLYWHPRPQSSRTGVQPRPLHLNNKTKTTFLARKSLSHVVLSSKRAHLPFRIEKKADIQRIQKWDLWNIYKYF